MARITIIGAGVMGTSMAGPALDNGHEVTLVGSPLDDAIIETMKADHAHPNLDHRLDGAVVYLHHGELRADHVSGSDVVMLGVASAGIPWSLKYLLGIGAPIGRLLILTNGLDASDDGGVRTLSPRMLEALAPLGVPPAIVGVGGPCIAQELANRAPTAVVYGYSARAAATFCKEVFETDYYHVRPSADLIGVEAGAALTSFMTIGVAAAWSHYENNAGEHRRLMSPAAAVFEQAVHELALLTRWLGGNPMSALRLPGVGDLFATVNTGRNSGLGRRLGAGDSVNEALAGNEALVGRETVEGVGVGRSLGPALYKAWQRDPVLAAEMPLTRALLNALLHNEPLAFDMGAYWHRDD